MALYLIPLSLRLLKNFLSHTVMFGYFILLAVLNAMLSFTLASVRNSTKFHTRVRGDTAARRNRMVMSERLATLDLILRHHLKPWAEVVSQNLTNVAKYGYNLSLE